MSPLSNAQISNTSVTMASLADDRLGTAQGGASMELVHSQETAPTENSVNPTVMVSMLDEHLVICAPTRLDLEMTKILVIAAASAVACGSKVMIDLDPDTTSDELIARRPLSAAANYVTSDGGPVAVLGAGYVQLTTRDGHWTIDLGQGRLCRSNDPVDPHFIGLDDWTPICALWVTQTSVTALANDGTYLSTFAAWTTEPRPRETHPQAQRVEGT
jgi:hypothetical protein